MLALGWKLKESYYDFAIITNWKFLFRIVKILLHMMQSFVGKAKFNLQQWSFPMEVALSIITSHQLNSITIVTSTSCFIWICCPTSGLFSTRRQFNPRTILLGFPNPCHRMRIKFLSPRSSKLETKPQNFQPSMSFTGST